MAGVTGFEEIVLLLADGGLPELGPGPRPGVLPHHELERSIDKALAKCELPSTNGELARALILLWHDRMDAAHEIAQGIENADGSFVHGIVHRREPDYGNARYWFRRVGDHPCFPELATKASLLLSSVGDARNLRSKLVIDGKWDALAFVDLCEKDCRRNAPEHEIALLRQLQGLETEVLLDYLMHP
jgi:hypothetical protein